MLLPCLQNTRAALRVQLNMTGQICGKGHAVFLGNWPKSPFPLRMVGDDEDEGALSDSDGNTVLPGDDLAKK